MKLKFNIYEYENDDPMLSGEVDVDMNELGHEICMGIRHGLFGIKSPDDRSIANSFDEVASGLHRIADAIDNISLSKDKEN